MKFGERGFAALLMLLVLLLAATSQLLASLNANKPRSTYDEEASIAALRQAKDALLGWSATHDTLPGSLPCPEDAGFAGSDHAGSTTGGCANTVFLLGRLPWRTLGLAELKDSAGEALWYGLAPKMRRNPINGAVTQNKLTIDGLADSAVAVIIAPGRLRKGQTRGTLLPSTALVAANYLEHSNAQGNGNFISSTNNRLVSITQKELFRVVNRGVLGRLKGDSAEGMIAYYNKIGSFPASDDFLVELKKKLATNTKTMLEDNNWLAQITYQTSADKQQVSLLLSQPEAISLHLSSCQKLNGVVQCLSLNE